MLRCARCGGKREGYGQGDEIDVRDIYEHLRVVECEFGEIPELVIVRI